MITFEATWAEIKSNFSAYAKNNKLIQILDVISSFRLFRHLNKKELVQYVSKMKLKKYTKGDIIMKCKQKMSEFMLVYKGTVKLTKEDNIKIREIEKGNSFGDFFLFNDQELPYNIIAKSKKTTLISFPQAEFITLLIDQTINTYMKEKMCLEDPHIKITDLYYLSYLGRGRFGNVCLVHNEISFYAAKAISKSVAEKQKNGVKYLLSEKKTMLCLDHPFIVKYVSTLKTDTWCFFLQEFISGKNLNDYLEAKKTIRNLAEVKFISAFLFIVMDYLHKKLIVHRDLKPSNIMIDNKNGYMKLIDFGASKKLKGTTKTVIGTPNFIPPEVLMGKGYSFQSDYWSIGIILYYAFYGILPFGNNATELSDTYKDILHKELTFPNKNNREVNSLLSSLLNKDPLQRYHNLQHIKGHALYKDFNWDDFANTRLKSPFAPCKDGRDNSDNLLILNSPFVAFMANEKVESNMTITLKIEGQSNNTNGNHNNTNSDWFEYF